ncbi:MAG: PQQ-binding-like beta-propeller repeat protein [Ignavibacteria bacterium]|nr:PQQ-binding-like beta-propeller repeat protein [Ignavibacteria bacterium]
MEPQHNYSYGPGGMQQQIYGRKKSKKGCLFAGLILLVLILGGTALAMFLIFDKVNDTVEDLTNKFTKLSDKDKFTGTRNVDERFSGGFIDALPVTSTATTSRIFILTDASKTYIETTKRPGHYSTGVACIDCKTIVYIYDPVSNSITGSSEFKYPDVVTSTSIALNNGKVYQFIRSYHETQAGVNVYDALTGKLISETKDFIAVYPDLGSGITEVNYRAEDRYASFETKDGRKNLVFSVDHEKMYSSEKELKAALEKNSEGESYIYALANENNDARRQLYRITAPVKQILTHRSTLMSYAGREGMLKNYRATSEKASDKNYIEGIIYAQDEEFVFLVSLDEAGKKANRIFTCVDAKTGKELWSVQQDGLFDYMKIDEVQNSQQSLHSTKDKISVSRLENLVLLKFKGDGVLAFDTGSGNKLWSIQPAPVSF